MLSVIKQLRQGHLQEFLRDKSPSYQLNRKRYHQVYTLFVRLHWSADPSSGFSPFLLTGQAKGETEQYSPSAKVVQFTAYSNPFCAEYPLCEQKNLFCMPNYTPVFGNCVDLRTLTGIWHLLEI